MTDVDVAELLAVATELARSAGALLRERAEHGRSDVKAKSSLVDLVTDADRASEAHIVQQLRARRPHDGLLGEEGASTPSETGIDWVFDPLDGTTNFVYSIPFYAVSIGVVRDGEPVAGAVYNPALDELYTASHGNGAFRNGTSLDTNDIRELQYALVATGFSYSAVQRAEQGTVSAHLLPRIRDLRRCGSAALDLCNVASGRVDAYYERNVRPWDIAAGTIIAREAGARVESIRDGPLVLAASTEPSDIIAAPPGIFEELRTIVTT